MPKANKKPNKKINLKNPKIKSTKKTHKVEKADYFSKFIQPLKGNHQLQLKLLIAGVVVVFLVAAMMVALIIIKKNKINKPQPVAYNIDVNEYKVEEEEMVEEEEPLTMPRRIDGLIVATEDANKVPVCVMIENAAFGGVRPQSGLSAASVVYELIVEGGITRLMAVYGGESADPVGPVRSARDTYLEFVAEIDCMYTHAGGSYTAMKALQEKGYKDLDGLRESKYFWRDGAKVSPHNFFTKTDNLYEAITIGHSWYEDSTYDPWLFRDASEQRLHEGDEGYVSEVNIYFGGAYDVRYEYDADNNNYKRFNGGIEHTDANTGQVLTVNNIIVQKVGPGWLIEGKGRINFPVTGEGEVYVFREGELVQGTWKKSDRLSRTKFYDQDGQEIELLRGNSWVEIVPEDRSFDYS